MTARSTDAKEAKRIFLQVVELADSASRQLALEQGCNGDEHLRREVLRLLHADQRSRLGLLDRVGNGLGVTRQVADLENGSWLADSSEASKSIGPYQLMEPLGEGGMGVVYVAQQQHPIRRKVALKIIKPGMASQQMIARFEAERQSLAIMSHPHIAKVFDAGTTDAGTPYFVMELVKGVPITQYCVDHKSTIAERLELFAKVCDAVQHAHQKGVIHRDLKPSNIMVELEDVRAVPKVIDFGVAKAIHQPLTEKTVYTGISQLIGTPLYMSPEQAELNSLDVDTRSDVYSLGVILYELVSGATPFDRETFRQAGFDEMRRMIREVDPPLPSSRVSTLRTRRDKTLANRYGDREELRRSPIRSELDWIVMKAMEKDRARRYQSAAELAADIQRYLKNEPVLAGPASWSYMFRKFVLRHRVLIGTAMMVSGAVVTGLVASMWFAYDAHAARKMAEDRLNREQKARREVKREAEAKQRALSASQESLDRALKIVNDMYVSVATDWIADDVALSELQQRFLANAHEFYDHVANHPEQYSLSLSQQVEICLRNGQIAEELGDQEQAASHYQQGVELLVELPEDPRHDLLAARAVLQASLAANRADQQRFDDAVAPMTLAISDLQKLAARVPEEPAFKTQIRHGFLGLVEFARRKGDAAAMRRHLMEAENVVLPPEFESYERRLGDLLIKNAQADLAAIAGELTTARSIAEESLAECRLAIVRFGDARLFYDVELDIQENLVRYELMAGDFTAAERQSQILLEHLVSRLTGKFAPDQYLIRNLSNPVQFKQADQPELGSRWIRIQLLRFQSLKELGRDEEAQWLLGRSLMVSDIFYVAYASDLRHHVDLANTNMLISLSLQETHPEEAAEYACAAANVWSEASRQFPNVWDYRSGLPPWIGGLAPSDFEWFVSKFPGHDVRDSAVRIRVSEQFKALSQDLVKRRAQAWIWADMANWNQCLVFCREIQEHRPTQQDLLISCLASECLFELGRLDEARRELQHVDSSTEQLEPFIEEVYERVRKKLDLMPSSSR